MRQVFLILLLTFLTSFLCSAQVPLSIKILKNIERSTPTALPQGPVVPKERSDADDKGLKGKVKAVTGESQDLSGTGRTDARHLSYIEHYDEKGNFVKRLSFDSVGNPSDITVYGYLNNARVSKTKTITYDYDPPPVMMAPGAAKPDQNPRDTRISYSYTYRYAEGKLSEILRGSSKAGQKTLLSSPFLV